MCDFYSPKGKKKNNFLHLYRYYIKVLINLTGTFKNYRVQVNFSAFYQCPLHRLTSSTPAMAANQRWSLVSLVVALCWATAVLSGCDVYSPTMCSFLCLFSLSASCFTTNTSYYSKVISFLSVLSHLRFYITKNTYMQQSRSENQNKIPL